MIPKPYKPSYLFLLCHSQEQYPVARNDAKLLSRKLAPSPTGQFLITFFRTPPFLHFHFPISLTSSNPKWVSRNITNLFPGFRAPMRPTSLYPLQLWPRVLVGNCTNFCGVHFAYSQCLLPSRHRQCDGAMWYCRKRTEGVSSSALASMGPWEGLQKVLLH